MRNLRTTSVGYALVGETDRDGAEAEAEASSAGQPGAPNLDVPLRRLPATLFRSRPTARGQAAIVSGYRPSRA
jgi:hypothetical protein